MPLKKQLSKALACCLNPEINVTHQLALETYYVIFRREIDIIKECSKGNEQAINWGDDLGLFYSALFNFYQFAAFECKKMFLKICKE